jgi:hypothetical protein
MKRTLKRATLLALAIVGVDQAARRIRAHLRANGVGSWKPLVPRHEFSACVRRAIAALRDAAPDEPLGDYLEFGVSRGTSLASVHAVLAESGLSGPRLVGFDSFEGMPPESAREGWMPGQFHSTLSATRRYLASEGVDLGRVELVKGWFSETLTPETRERLAIGKASLIMIDCDIYSASRTALDFCEPHIGDRAVIMLDDWGWRANGGKVGQKEAFEEFLAAHPELRAEPMPSYLPEARVFLVTRSPGVTAPG